jgi:hypothetical protein
VWQGGIVNATDLQLADGRFSAQVQASEVQIGRLAPVPAQLNGPLSGTFKSQVLWTTLVLLRFVVAVLDA